MVRAPARVTYVPVAWVQNPPGANADEMSRLMYALCISIGYDMMWS